MSTLALESGIEEGAVLGASVPRIDGLPKVTGAVRYARDLSLPHMLYGKIKRSPYPHAKILGIDLSPGLKIPGVRVALTGRDFPLMETEDTPPLAQGVVLYAGQGVVAVAAESRELVDDAVDAVEIQYEPMPALLDPEAALSPDSPVIIRHPKSNSKAPNIGRHLKIRVGDAEEAFRRADRIVENTFTTAPETHFQVEPLSFLAQPALDGGVSIWATSSGAQKVQAEVASYLGLDRHRVRAIVPFMGGWFGSKEENHLSAVCAQLALKSGRPVKLELSREESITASGVRHPAVISVKDGIMKDGRIVARQVRALYDGGAYGSLGNTVVRGALLSGASVYRIPHFTMDVYRAYTNKVPGTPKRAPISVQINFALESQIETIARLLQMDPVELRMRHLMEEGDVNLIGEEMVSISHKECLRKVVEAFAKIRKGDLPPPWKVGRGFAVGAKPTSAGPWQAMVRVREDGSVEVWAAVVENGQGAYTAICQMVAQEFGIPVKKVRLKSFNEGSDSSVTGASAGASASRQTVNLGKALLAACREAKRRVAEKASDQLKVPPEELEVRGGRVFRRGDPSRSVEIGRLFTAFPLFGKLSRTMVVEGGEFVGFGVQAQRVAETDPETGRVQGGRASPYYVSVAQGVEVAVNPETGRIRVLRVAAAMDVGKAVNPWLVTGQIEGTVAMALSATLGEELVVSDGRIVNAELADYKILSSMDVPTILPIIVETPSPHGPYGAKGGGEGSMLPTAAAVRSAIYDALGVWINSLPITAEKVLMALRTRG